MSSKSLVFLCLILKICCTEACISLIIVPTQSSTNDDKLVTIGGRDRPENFVSIVELISPSSNNDECDPTNLNYGVSHHASVLSPDGKMVWCGGIGKNDSVLSKCQVQAPTGETRPFPSMINKRYYLGMSIIDGIIYNFGGWPSGNKMESININTGNQWKEEQNLPFRALDHCFVTIGSKIAVIGGWNGGKLDTMWIYDSIHKNWTRGPSLNVKRHYHSCMVDQKTSTIHVMGGYGQKNDRLSSTEN